MYTWLVINFTEIIPFHRNYSIHISSTRNKYNSNVHVANSSILFVVHGMVIYMKINPAKTSHQCTEGQSAFHFAEVVARKYCRLMDFLEPICNNFAMDGELVPEKFS